MAPQISHKHKCIFVHVPKTGGTSIEITKLFDDQREATGEYVGGHTTALEFQEQFPAEFKDYFKFAFVRNPFDRLVSAFLYLNKGGTTKGDKEVFEKHLIRYNGNFSLFCRNFLSRESIQAVTHLRPQVDYVCDQNGTVLVNFLGKLENMESDYYQILQRFAIGSKLRHKNRSQRQLYPRYYDGRSRKIVETIYEQDLEQFSYQYESSIYLGLRLHVARLRRAMNKSL